MPNLRRGILFRLRGLFHLGGGRLRDVGGIFIAVFLRGAHIGKSDAQQGRQIDRHKNDQCQHQKKARQMPMASFFHTGSPLFSAL